MAASIFLQAGGYNTGHINMSYGGVSLIPSGLIKIQDFAVGTPASTTLTTLGTVSIPAGALLGSPNGGQVIRITAWGALAGNANGKTINVKVGGTTVASDSGAHNGGGWGCEVVLFNPIDSGAQLYTSDMIMLRASVRTRGILALNMSNAIDVVVEGQNAVATANDITLNGILIESLPWYSVE